MDSRLAQEHLCILESKANHSIANLPQSLDIAINLSNDALLLPLFGTRSIPWRISLGILTPDPYTWPDQLKRHHDTYSKLLCEY
jgi:hypothetical protein